MPYFFECETCDTQTSFDWFERQPIERICADCGRRGCSICMDQPVPRCTECVRVTEVEDE